MFILIKKFFPVWLCLWLLGLGLTLYQVRETSFDSSELKVVFCDVGQGDAILIADGDYQILIDGGPDESILNCLRQEINPSDLKIETMVLTHPDSDHLVGLTKTLEIYKVDKLIMNNLPKATKDFDDFYNLIWKQKEENKLKVENIKLAQKWCETEQLCFQALSDFSELLPEDIFSYKRNFRELSDMLKNSIQKNINFNNESIVFNLIVDNKILTLTGDVERAGELAMVGSGLLTKVDVLKTAHHGSKTSSSREILEILQPEISVISVGQNNKFGHPNDDTLIKLNEIDTQILRTDIHGKIKMIKKDNHWIWETEK